MSQVWRSLSLRLAIALVALGLMAGSGAVFSPNTLFAEEEAAPELFAGELEGSVLNEGARIGSTDHMGPLSDALASGADAACAAGEPQACPPGQEPCVSANCGCGCPGCHLCCDACPRTCVPEGECCPDVE